MQAPRLAADSRVHTSITSPDTGTALMPPFATPLPTGTAALRLTNAVLPIEIALNRPTPALPYPTSAPLAQQTAPSVTSIGTARARTSPLPPRTATPPARTATLPVSTAGTFTRKVPPLCPGPGVPKSGHTVLPAGHSSVGATPAMRAAVALESGPGQGRSAS